MKTTFATTLLQAEGKNATGIQVPAEAVSALGTQKRPMRNAGWWIRSSDSER
jgi:hypothetical protein